MLSGFRSLGIIENRENTDCTTEIYFPMYRTCSAFIPLQKIVLKELFHKLHVMYFLWFLLFACIYATHGKTMITSSNRTEMNSPSPCCHEEADTRLLVHGLDANLKGDQRVKIRTNDTDVVVLAISACQMPRYGSPSDWGSMYTILLRILMLHHLVKINHRFYQCFMPWQDVTLSPSSVDEEKRLHGIHGWCFLSLL